ncbi:MAG: threonine synthase [Granulosicoccus sp.]|nr:threonine synthase [Granulosicoccus sp.]
MKYISTRGQAPTLDFGEVVTTGLATDGGLYVPERWPSVAPDVQQDWAALSYVELVVEVMSLFAGDAIPRVELERMSRKAYSGFSHPAIAPLQQLEEKLWIMELFHGPTLAFKDFALQFLGQLFEYLLAQRNEHRVIVGATSGDTGSAAIEAVRGLEQVTLFMLHPKGRVSEVQRRQMTTVTDANIHNIAIDGDFDDCQRLVKSMFNDAQFRDEMGLSAVNSINWARVAAQVVYYFRAALTLGSERQAVSFSVPSGNFGNVFAGFVAREMGLPVNQFVVGSNHNDILTRFFATGTMQTEGVKPSITPSMDIQVSSNFERLLFELTERDGSMVRNWMTQFSEQGKFSVTEAQYRKACNLFSAGRLDDQETRNEMARLFKSSAYIVDPHSAIGVATARRDQTDGDGPMVVLATAHPAKFPQAVFDAIGQEALLPARVKHIMRAQEKMESAPADLNVLQNLIRDSRGAH